LSLNNYLTAPPVGTNNLIWSWEGACMTGDGTTTEFTVSQRVD